MAATTYYRTRCFVGEGPSGASFAYVQVPKVACTSLKAAIMPALGPAEGDTVHRALRDSPSRFRKHKLAKAIRDGQFPGIYIFSFVRNPFDRLVSCYHSKFTDERVFLRQPGVRLGMTFREFAEAVCEVPDEESDQHVRSQWTFFDGLEVDFLGRFENLAADFAEVGGVLGLPPELPHANPSGRPAGYRDHYDAGLASRVAERYAADLEAFGYRF
jgi:hypothetical protein